MLPVWPVIMSLLRYATVRTPLSLPSKSACQHVGKGREVTTCNAPVETLKCAAA